MKVENPAAAKLLIRAARGKRRRPRLHRLVCVLLNSDVFCDLPDGIAFPHPYGVMIHSQAVIGENTTVMQQVTIGGKSVTKPDGAPTLGRGCYVGAGARILGPVRIGDNVTIGANAVVTRDAPDGGVVVGANQILVP